MSPRSRPTTLVEFTLEQEEPVIFCLDAGPELRELPAGARVWVDTAELPHPEAFGVEMQGQLIWLLRAEFKPVIEEP